jgi:hypothetical protein
MGWAGRGGRPWPLTPLLAAASLFTTRDRAQDGPQDWPEESAMIVLPPAGNGPGTSGHWLVPPGPEARIITTRGVPQEELARVDALLDELAGPPAGQPRRHRLHHRRHHPRGPDRPRRTRPRQLPRGGQDQRRADGRPPAGPSRLARRLELQPAPRTTSTAAPAPAALPRTRAAGLGAPGPDRPGRQRLEPDDQRARVPLPGPARR